MSELALPNNLDAERAVLGAILVDNQRINDTLEIVRPEHFFRVAHRRVLERMVLMAERQQAIDLVTLVDDLRRAELLEDVGGPAYVSALVDGVPRGTNVAEYARIVREKAELRRLIASANKMLNAAYETTEDCSDILAAAEREIIGLADRTSTTGFEAMRTIAMRGLDQLELASRDRKVVVGVPSGFAELDQLTRGFQSGTLVTIGARPGMGKSSLGLNIAQYAALQGYTTGVFSLEMEKSELFVRQVASRARIDSYRLNTGFVGEREWASIAQAVGEIAEAPLFIDETPAVSIYEVRSRARRLKVEHDLRLLVLDYLQLMAPSERLHNRTLELAAITGALKGLAKELKVPILLLSQLSRDLEKRGGRPKLSDLRDSGSIEQDSDIVMFLYRDDNTDDVSAPTELIIAKHRGGPVGTVKLAWFDSQTRFETFTPYEHPVDQRLPVGDR